jgi:hypothetical protein
VPNKTNKLRSKKADIKSLPLQAWRGPWGFQEVEAPEFLDNRHMKVVRLSALRTGRLYLQEEFLVFISGRGLVNPRATMRPEGLSHRKIPVTVSGTEPATFRLVAQCLKHLRHRLHPRQILGGGEMLNGYEGLYGRYKSRLEDNIKIIIHKWGLFNRNCPHFFDEVFHFFFEWL